MPYHRNALFAGGICPHMYCRPILKREEHRQRLVEAATSGKPYFFAGSDSAPHSVGSKESACGCAGVFTAHASTCLPLLLLERLSHDLTLTQPLLLPHLHPHLSSNTNRLARFPVVRSV